MPLHFPNLDIFRLALTGGAAPPELTLVPADAHLAGGAVWLTPSATVSKTAQAHLKKLGVLTPKPADSPTLDLRVGTWLEVLPATRELHPAPLGNQTPVLFEISDAAQLATLAGEMLRLGNDRQGYRWLQPTEGGSASALLRVVGPPYYTLLRAVDRLPKLME